MTTMQKVLVSVTITAMLLLGIYAALSGRSERPAIERVLGDVGIPDAELERLERLMELEQRGLKQHPAYQKFMETDPESSKWKGKRGPEAAAAGLAAAEQLKAKGLPMLSAEDLVVVNRIHSRIASVSPLMCTQMWIGGGPDSYAEVIRSLSKLTDAEVRQWLRVSANATILALETPPDRAPGNNDDTLMSGFEATAEALEPAEAERYWSIFDATVDWAANDGPSIDDADACFMTKTILRESAALDEPLRTRFWRAYLAAQMGQ